jgi:hypothetical protein
MRALIAGNFMNAIIAGIVLVIVGGVLAFKADSKAGYGVLAGGALLILYAMRVHGLI